jgi:hypothetical protein
VVAFTGEQGFGLELGDVFVGGQEFAVDVLQERVPLLAIALFLGEVNVGLDVAGKRGELFLGADARLGGLALLQDALGFFLVLPKIGLGAGGF